MMASGLLFNIRVCYRVYVKPGLWDTLVPRGDMGWLAHVQVWRRGGGPAQRERQHGREQRGEVRAWGAHVWRLPDQPSRAAHLS